MMTILNDLMEHVSVPPTFDEQFFEAWTPYLLVAVTFVVTLLVGAAVAYAVYTSKKAKLGKQVRGRVEYVTKSMAYGYISGTVHPTIEDVQQSGNYVHLKGVKCLDRKSVV